MGTKFLELFLELVLPQDGILQAIIVVILIFDAIIFVKLFSFWRRTEYNLRLLGEMRDVSFLEKVLKMNNVDYEASFSNYKSAVLSKAGISEEKAKPVLEHLKAIYDAGHRSSRLEPDLLVNNTIGKIYEGIDTLRAGISLLLVLGILGTLFGLAESFRTLAASGVGLTPNTGNIALNALGISQNIIANITGALKGAFAPSMCGVFSTIVFVLGFSWKIQDGCINKLTVKLTDSTVNNWLPVLYPTDFQKSENSMVKLRETVRNADKINTGANDLMHNLTEANATVKALQLTAKSITECNAAFDRGTHAFGALRETLTDMKGQVKSQNDQFYAFVTTSMTKWGVELKRQSDELEKQVQTVSEKLISNSKQAAENYAQQANQINDQLTKTLNAYEKHYMEVQKSQKDSLTAAIAQNKEAAAQMRGVTQEATARMGAMTERAKELKQELINAVGQPLQAVLQRELQSMNDTLDRSLGEVNKNLETQVGKPLHNGLQVVSEQLAGTTNKLAQLDTTMAKGLDEVGTKVSNDLVTKVGQPLRQDLAEKLHEVSGKLEKAADELHGLNSPLGDALDNTRNIFEHFYAKMEKLLSEKTVRQEGITPALGTETQSVEMLGEKLDAILEELREQENRRQKSVGAGEAKSGKSSWLPITIAIIVVSLIFSLLLQWGMYSKLSDLQVPKVASDGRRVSVQVEDNRDRLANLGNQKLVTADLPSMHQRQQSR